MPKSDETHFAKLVLALLVPHRDPKDLLCGHDEWTEAQEAAMKNLSP